MSEITLEGAGAYHEQLIRKRSDVREAQIGQNVVHDTKRYAANAYRPIRTLPSLFERGSTANTIDKEGMVWAQGKFLGKYDRQINSTGWKYQDDEYKLGIQTGKLATGEFYAYIDVNGSGIPVAFDNPDWGNSIDIKGFLGPANGSAYGLSDKYTALDVWLKRIDPKAGALVAADGQASIRAKWASDTKYPIFGVATRDTMRETRNNHYHYQRNIEAFGVAKEGYLTLPFAVSGGDLTVDGDLAADPFVRIAASATQQDLVSRDQTILFLGAATDLVSGTKLVVDAWGNPFKNAAGSYPTDMNIVLTDFTFSTDIPWGKYVNTYPPIEVAGTGTTGKEAQIFYMVRKIMETNSPASTFTIGNIATYLENNPNLYGFATIRYDIP